MNQAAFDALLGRIDAEIAEGPAPLHKIAAVVRMPYGDEDVHDVVLQLQKMRLRRERGKPKEQGWIVDWKSEKGIPFRVHSWKGNEVIASSVRVSDRDVESGAWPYVAVTRIAEKIMRDRVRYGLTPARFEDHIEPAMEL